MNTAGFNLLQEDDPIREYGYYVQINEDIKQKKA